MTTQALTSINQATKARHLLALAGACDEPETRALVRHEAFIRLALSRIRGGK